MNGSPETHRSLQYNFGKPFKSALNDAKDKLHDLDALAEMAGFRDDLEEIYVENRDPNLKPHKKRQLVRAANFGLDKQALKLRRIEAVWIPGTKYKSYIQSRRSLLVILYSPTLACQNFIP